MGSGFKIQAYPCLSSVPGFLAVYKTRVGSPESCLKPISAALVIPAPQPASASPAPIPLTHNVSSHLHHLYPIQKKRKMACRIYRHTNQYTRPHYLDFILKCGLCWIICAIVNPSQTIFLRISEISISRDFFLSLAWKGQRTF